VTGPQVSDQAIGFTLQLPAPLGASSKASIALTFGKYKVPAFDLTLPN
jgi:hypothetical protein